MRALVIVDLGFGDAGKGLLTDFLVRRTGARMVVRYNGGAQAGHNVVTPDGRHHTFAQFGSGTFVPGVRTFLSRDVVVHPTALLREAWKLRANGVGDAFDRLSISADALVITPYHQALNRLRETARGLARHGSCGVGVGETVAHDRIRPGEAVRMIDLTTVDRLRHKLLRIRDYAFAEGRGLGELAILDSPGVIEQWIGEARSVAPLITDEDGWVPGAGETVVFEGAHGILLDEWHGFHPYTTWGPCTTANATALLSQFAPDAEARTIGVIRSYAVRHGPGPMPTETEDIGDVPAEYNGFNEWQGAVRRGWFDGVLTRYAIEANGGVDGLAVTHCDALSRRTSWTYCDNYIGEAPPRPSAVRSLARQERITSKLASVQPRLRHCPATEPHVFDTIEQITGTPVEMGSRGPSADHVFIRPGNDAEVERGADRRREVG